MEEYNLPNLEFLFYEKPDQYKGFVNESDPNVLRLTSQEVDFEEYIKECQARDYLNIIFQIFLNGYPQYPLLKLLLMDSKISPKGMNYVGPKRKDEIFPKLEFLEVDYPYFEDFSAVALEKLILTVQKSSIDVESIINEALDGMDFETTVTSTGKTISIKNSVIESIQIDDTSIIIQLNEKHYKYYY